MNTDELRDIANTLRACADRIAALVLATDDKVVKARLRSASAFSTAARFDVIEAAAVLEELAVPGEGEV